MSFKSMVAGLALAVTFTGAALAAECKIEGEAEAGKTVANQCKGCHEFDAAKPSRATGPNLSGVYGGKAGAVADFTKYSDAMKTASAKVTWDDKSLSSYIADPKAFLASVNGKDIKHGMFFQLKDDAKRGQVVAYLKALKACK